MIENRKTKYIHEGPYVAEVEVEIIKAVDGWSPYIKLEDAYLIDEIKSFLKKGDIAAASKKSRVYTLQPIAS
jgi:hypothetical protein